MRDDTNKKASKLQNCNFAFLQFCKFLTLNEWRQRYGQEISCPYPGTGRIFPDRAFDANHLASKNCKIAKLQIANCKLQNCNFAILTSSCLCRPSPHPYMDSMSRSHFSRKPSLYGNHRFHPPKIVGNERWVGIDFEVLTVSVRNFR